MKIYKKEGDTFYKTPWERDESRQKHKHRMSCQKARKKRKKRRK